MQKYRTMKHIAAEHKKNEIITRLLPGSNLWSILFLLLFGVGNVWAYDFTEGKVIYFDNKEAWTKCYLRVGHTTHNSAYLMTKVDNTLGLYKYTIPSWGGYAAYSVANNCGWTGDNSIYKVKTGDSNAITASTAYTDTSVSTDRTIWPTSWKNKDEDCDYYNISNEEGLQKYSVTRSVSGSGTLAIKYTSDGDGTMATSAAASSGSVSVIISGNVEVTATPSSGYALTALSLGSKTFYSSDLNSGHYDFSGVREARTLSATFTAITNKTIKIKDTDSWGGIKVYMWNDITGAENATFPGVAATAYNGSSVWYTVTLSTQYTHFIISKNGDQNTKSNDIPISDATAGNCYTTTTGDLPAATPCPDVPTVSTSSASSIDMTHATMGGNITWDGSDAISSYGYYYSTNSTLSSANAESVGTRVEVGNSHHTGSYSSSTSGLSVGTTYYVIAYATNVHGTGWGSVDNFTTTVATLELSGTKDYAAKTMTITPTHNITPANGYSGNKYICCTCTSQPGEDELTISWNSTTQKIEISGATTSGDYTFNVQLKPVSDCSGGAFNNATANITITMKDFVDYSGLTIGHAKYNSTYMAGDGASATPYFVYLQHAGTYGKLNLSATLASALSDGDLYYSVGGVEIGTVSTVSTAASVTMDLPNKTAGDKRSTTIQFYHKLDGQTAPNAKRASVTVYYQVNANPVVTLTATYNGNPVVGEIPQSATVTLSASVTNIPGEPTFTYSKESGEYSSTTSYTLSEAGTTTMHAKTTYLGDWTGDLNITTYAANSVNYTTRKTDMYGDESSISTSRLFKNTGEEYTAPDIEGYRFSDWTCSDAKVQVSDDSGETWGSSSTNQTVYVKATSPGGTLTAHYNEVKRIYFDNRFAKWSGGDIYVYLFSGDSWYNDYNGTDGNGPGVVPRINQIEYGRMTQIGESDIYYYEYATESSFSRVAFSVYDQHAYSHLYDTKGVWRTDFSTCNPCYVAPENSDQTKYDHGNGYSTYYYNNGYWRRYMPQYAPFSLYFTDGEDSGDKGKFVPEDAGVDGENFKLEVLRGSGTTYHFNLPNACGTAYGNNGEITKDDCTNWTFQPTSGSIGNCRLTTNAGGTYIFHLSTANGEVKLSVEYPLNEGDYQVYYTDNTGKNNNYSDFIRKNTSASGKDYYVSFYVKKNASPTYQVKRCTGFDGSGDPTWENVGTAQSISVDKDSVYVFNFNQPAGGASISMTSQSYYSGNYYIRTDGAGGGWANYLSNPDNKMKHTDKASAWAAGYNYYYLRWIGDKDGNSTANVKFTVANDYNSSVSQEMGNDPAEGSLNGGQYLTGKGANVRFTYNTSTNQMTRTYIGGSGHDANYLVIDGENLKKSDGSAWAQSALSDKNDWIYTIDLKAAADATITLKSHYNNKYVVILPSEKIFDASDANYYDLKLIYDYKTNEIVAAYIPGTVNSELEVDVDIMFIRYAKDNYETAPPTTLSFGPEGSITGEPKTLYGAIEFEKNYVRAESSYAGLSSKRPQRSTYWISFPFDVRIKDIFGLGDYTETWILSRYRGDLRAANGWFLENDTFWEYILDQNETLKAGEGYVLSIDCEAIQWPNSITTQYLYFPSKDKISTINSVLPGENLQVPAHTCTITSPADRHIKDSHWNVIGIPGFATGWGKAEATVTVAGGDFHYFYTWDAATNTLSSASAKKYKFEFMHSYMVQYTGDISWHASEPATLPARRIKSSLPEEVEFRLALSKDGQETDHTFVTLMDNEKVTADFDMNTDLVKMFNSNQANIYTIIGSDVQAAANCLPLSQTETTLVPMGVKTTTAGIYTISIPSGTYGIGVTLIDEQTGVRTSLSAMDYIVELDADDYTNRFFLEIAPVKTMPTDIENVPGDDVQGTKARKIMIDGILYIRKDGKIYDARGVRIQ